MRSKVLAGILCLILALSLSACSGNADDDKKSSDVSSKQTEKTATADSDASNEKEDAQQETENDSAEDQPVENAGSALTILVYYSNADATAFESADVSIESLSPDSVLKGLVSQGALTADVAVNTFTIDKVDQKKSIELDLNKAFSSYISNMGSTGEYYTVGALVNTFLDAYKCDQIKITIDGGDLSTGHAEYPGYLTKFN